MICIKCGEKLDSEQCRNCDFDLKAHYFSLIPFSYGYGIGQFYHSLAQGLRLKKSIGLDEESDSQFVALEEHAASEGFSPAMIWLAYCYDRLAFRYPDRKDYKDLCSRWYGKAKKALLSAAESGDIYSQYLLGELYLNLPGRWLSVSWTPDYKEAKRWLEKSASRGYRQSDYLFGIMYRDGLGVEKNLDESIQRLKKSSDVDQKGLSEYCIGLIYYEEKNEYEEALKWFLESDKKGFLSASLMLSKMYKDGRGVLADENKARYWVEQNKIKASNRNKK